jgi:hypothetical protein
VTPVLARRIAAALAAVRSGGLVLCEHGFPAAAEPGTP